MIAQDVDAEDFEDLARAAGWGGPDGFAFDDWRDLAVLLEPQQAGQSAFVDAEGGLGDFQGCAAGEAFDAMFEAVQRGG